MIIKRSEKGWDSLRNRTDWSFEDDVVFPEPPESNEEFDDFDFNELDENE